MEDKQIISLFNLRSQRAIEETRIKYGKLIYRIANNVLASSRDSEEVENDTYYALWNKIPPEQPDPYKSYVCRIAKNTALNKYAHNTAAKRNSRYDESFEELSEVVGPGESPEEAVEARELTEKIESFLDGLTLENRVIFVKRHYFNESYDDISAATGLTKDNVSVRLTRIRKELKDFLTKEGILA